MSPEKPDKLSKQELPPTKKKNPHAVAMGKKGGPIGGKARAAKMTPEERSASAKKAALARWSKKP